MGNLGLSEGSKSPICSVSQASGSNDVVKREGDTEGQDEQLSDCDK